MFKSSYRDIYINNFRPDFTDYHRYFNLIGGKNKKKKTYKNNIEIRGRKRSLKGGVIYGKGKYRFDFKVDVNEDKTRIFIGNKINCFLGSIMIEDKTKLIIQGFAFNKYCNLEKNLDPGRGTKIMFNTIIDFIKDNYQKIKTVEFSDNAITYCYSEIIKERISLQLYYLYLLKYGKGYYMQNFGFTISYNDDIILHKDNIKNYLKFVLKYEDFKKYLTSGANKKYEKLIDELRRFFTINGELKQELHFKDISRNLKQNKYDCYFLRQLIIYIIRNADLYNLTYNTYHLSI